MRRRLPVLVGLAVVAALGCGFLRSLVGRNTVDLSEADVKSMSVDLRKTQKTICPREKVQLAVFATAVLDTSKGPQQFETWSGSGSRNGKLDFSDFVLHSNIGTIDDEGWFRPDPNLLTSIDREYELTTAFKKRPDKFTFKTEYKPDYVCIKGAERNGESGSSGASGGTGASGGAGGDGAPGPEFLVYATMIKTKFYDKVVAVVVKGGLDDVLLFPLESKITLAARGGPGGSGGRGGAGSRGTDASTPGARGGDGGPGGPGGHGGNGGRGGNITLTFDSRFPELSELIAMDVSGGAPGPGGSGGPGGPGGSGGPAKYSSGTGGAASYTPSIPAGSPGSTGAMGSAGPSGHPGNNGVAAAKPGQVADTFSSLRGMTVL